VEVRVTLAVVSCYDRHRRHHTAS